MSADSQLVVQKFFLCQNNCPKDAAGNLDQNCVTGCRATAALDVAVKNLFTCVDGTNQGGAGNGTGSNTGGQTNACDAATLLTAATTESQTLTTQYTQGATDCAAKTTEALKKICLKGLRAAFDGNTTLGPKLRDYINCVNPPALVCGLLDAAARVEEKATSLANDSRVGAFYNELNACPSKTTTALVAQCRDDVQK